MDETPQAPTNQPEPTAPADAGVTNPDPFAAPAAPEPTPESAPESAPAVDPVPMPDPISDPMPAPAPAPDPNPTPAEPVAAPAPEPAPAPAPEPEPAEPLQPMKPGEKKVLLVEDDDALAGVYVTRLQAEGFNVKRVANGEDALSAAQAYRPDLILLDVMMPKVSGFDVLDILRNTPDIGNTKVIMLTALSQDNDVERAKELGADDYLVKSQVVIADVIDRIKHHLSVA